MTLEIQAPRLGEAQEGGRVKPVNGIYVRNNNHSFIKKKNFLDASTVLTVNTI